MLKLKQNPDNPVDIERDVIHTAMVRCEGRVSITGYGTTPEEAQADLEAWICADWRAYVQAPAKELDTWGKRYRKWLKAHFEVEEED